MASIDSIDFIKKSYCADYGTVRKFYDDVKTDIDVIDRFLIDGGADTFFNRNPALSIQYDFDNLQLKYIYFL
jgi:phage terminase small subunit